MVERKPDRPGIYASNNEPVWHLGRPRPRDDPTGRAAGEQNGLEVGFYRFDWGFPSSFSFLFTIMTSSDQVGGCQTCERIGW